jgi:hypothetical protein
MYCLEALKISNLWKKSPEIKGRLIPKKFLRSY